MFTRFKASCSYFQAHFPHILPPNHNSFSPVPSPSNNLGVGRWRWGKTHPVLPLCTPVNLHLRIRFSFDRLWGLAVQTKKTLWPRSQHRSYVTNLSANRGKEGHWQIPAPKETNRSKRGQKARDWDNPKMLLLVKTLKAEQILKEFLKGQEYG